MLRSGLKCLIFFIVPAPEEGKWASFGVQKGSFLHSVSGSFKIRLRPKRIPFEPQLKYDWK